MRQHGGAHVLHQVEDVICPTILVRLNEVGVLGGHVRRAQAESLEAGRLDQPTGGIIGRVGEDRARVGASRLMLPSPRISLIWNGT